MRVWEESPFHEDDELDLSRWNEILARSALIQARGQALSLLSRAASTVAFSSARSYSNVIMNPRRSLRALDELESSGALSDERYAESWVRSRLRVPP